MEPCTSTSQDSHALMCHHHHHRHHLSLNREGHWGTSDDFKTSFPPVFSVLHCPPGPSRPVHSLMLSSHLFLPCLLPPFTVPYYLMNRRHVHTTTHVCVCLNRYLHIIIYLQHFKIGLRFKKKKKKGRKGRVSNVLCAVFSV